MDSFSDGSPGAQEPVRAWSQGADAGDQPAAVEFVIDLRHRHLEAVAVDPGWVRASL
jgi:hypothetical protein